MKKILIILTGLLLAGGTTRAVPTLDIDVQQDGGWIHFIATPVDFPADTTEIFYQIFAREHGGFYRYNLDPVGFGWHQTAIYAPVEGGTVLITADIFPAGITVSESFETMPYTPVPDGGATAVMLGLGALGLVFAHRRLQAPR